MGYSAALFATLLMGLVGLFVRKTVASEQIIALFRFGIGFVFYVIFLSATGNLHYAKARLSLPLVLSGIFMALCILCYIKAITRTSLANAAFLLYLAPLLATGLGSILLRERLKPINAALLALAFIGCLFILEFKVSLRVEESSEYFYGIASALLYALFITANRHIPQEVSVLARVFYQLLFGTLVILPFAGIAKMNLSYADLYWLVAIGFFQGFLASTLMISAIKFLQVQEYATISYLEPVIATIVGIVFLSEPLSLLQVVGGGIIMLSNLTQILFVKD